jgi:hypothetical protein
MGVGGEVDHGSRKLGFAWDEAVTLFYIQTLK